jgi:maleylacetoacetate isomerase
MLKLYNYWRSSSSYRVRIALNLKLIQYESIPVHLLRDGGEQHKPEYRALNPQEMVPLLVDGDFALGQSLAIFQYLEAQVPQPALVPEDSRDAARMWSFCQVIASDVQPLHNTRLLQYLGKEFGVDEERRKTWVQHWIGLNLDALEQELQSREATPYCFGETPTYADCCLVPQLYAAERFGAVRDWPRLQAIATRCREHEGFIAAHPDLQVDAQKV